MIHTKPKKYIGQSINLQYVEYLESDNKRLKIKNENLIGLVLRMVNRWWCFVHNSLPSEAARKLHDEAVGVIEENSK